MRTRVKICGLTNILDAQNAVMAGADAIGLVFYPPSPRNVTVEQAADIAQSIPAFVTKTALFVNPTVELVQEVLAKVKIDLLQFHGDEAGAFCQQFGRSYIKAIAMKPELDLNAVAQEYESSQGILLDTYKPGIPGGTGESFNWQLVPKQFPKPIILAGGLNPENVVTAIEQTAVWAVDVSGGVEAAKGVKSQAKMQQFMQQVMSTVK